MKINWKEHVLARSKIFNIAIICFSEALHDAIKNRADCKPEEEMVEVKLTIAGVEIDLEKVVKRWQENIDTCIEREAKELVTQTIYGNTGGIHDLVNEFEKDLIESIQKNLKGVEPLSAKDNDLAAILQQKD